MIKNSLQMACLLRRVHVSLTHTQTLRTSVVSLAPADGLGLKKRQRKTEKEPHYFETLCQPHNDESELVKLLEKNILFQDKHLLAINKPNGLPMHSFKQSLDEETVDSIEEVSGLSVSSVLPHLAQVLETPSLTPAFSQHRLFSGVVVLAKTEKAVLYLKKYFKHTRAQKLLYQKYTLLTLGIPDPLTATDCMNLEKHTINDYRLAIKAKTRSNKRRKRRSQVALNCKYNVLSSYKGSQCRVAFVEMWPTFIKWDAVQLYFLHKLSPVFGDHHYSSRLRSILNQPVLIDPMQCSPSPQAVPVEVANHLNISVSESSIVPLHIHCAEVTIPDIITKKDILIKAPLPEFFDRTINSLPLTNT